MNIGVLGSFVANTPITIENELVGTLEEHIILHGGNLEII